jgi:hypothetical protein
VAKAEFDIPKERNVTLVMTETEARAVMKSLNRDGTSETYDVWDTLNDLFGGEDLEDDDK